MGCIYVVRADYYSNGQILPLGFTDSYGKTTYIQQVTKTEKMKTGEYYFKCIADNKSIILVLRAGKWDIIDR